MRAFKLMDTVDEAQILKVNIRVPGTDRMPFIRTFANLIFKNLRIVILDATDSMISQVNILKLPSTIISISNPIHSTNWHEVTVAVGHVLIRVIFRDFQNTLTIISFNCSGFV
jgi:hypothetical protein